jgi:tungstate transport system ATP-binding protein
MINLTFDNMLFADQDKNLLGPINVDLNLNGITCVLGYNGAGKSLFLELCHGMLEPTLGTVNWNGETALTTRNKRGFIFQSRIILRRSVRENIALPMQAAGWSRNDIDTRTNDLLEMARLTTKGEEPAAVLSGGETQRMALVRALATRPNVLIMDEPTSSLDPNATTKFETMIEAVASTGVKFIWATHNIAQAKRFADNIIFINDGTIAEHGPASDFFTAPKSKIAQTYVEGH